MEVLPLPVPPATLDGAGAAGPGSLVSGTVHKVWKLGQKLATSDLRDEEPEPMFIGRRGGSGRGVGAGSSGRRSNVGMSDLVESGILVPGRNKISVTYKGVTTVANLANDGSIEYQGKRYGSATAFSIYCKRLITPGKQGDDGWKSVLYENRPLEHFRKEYQSRLHQGGRGKPPPVPRGAAARNTPAGSAAPSEGIVKLVQQQEAQQAAQQAALAAQQAALAAQQQQQLQQAAAQAARGGGSPEPAQQQPWPGGAAGAPPRSGSKRDGSGTPGGIAVGAGAPRSAKRSARGSRAGSATASEGGSLPMAVEAQTDPMQ